VHEAPTDGWFLDVYYCNCTDRGVTTEWYPTEEAARAALQCLAVARHRVVEENYLDLTISGCYES
jgi:hypothetical protein